MIIIYYVIFNDTSKYFEKFDKIIKVKNKQNNTVQFISINPNTMATKSEVKDAIDLKYKRPLKRSDCTYLKLLEKWKPTQYKDLFSKTMKLIEEKSEAFAQYTCDRKTLNVEPVGLGIKPGYENAEIKIDQYPLNRDTMEMDKSGFWKRLTIR